MKRFFLLILLLSSSLVKAGLIELQEHIQQYLAALSEEIFNEIYDSYLSLEETDRAQGLRLLSENNIVLLGINDADTLRSINEDQPIQLDGPLPELISDAVAEQLEIKLSEQDKNKKNFQEATTQFNIVSTQKQLLADQLHIARLENTELLEEVNHLKQAINELPEVAPIQSQDARILRIIGILKGQNRQLEASIAELQQRKRQLQDLLENNKSDL